MSKVTQFQPNGNAPFSKRLKWMVENPPAGSVRMVVTPAMADDMLKFNTGNRAVSDARVREYAAEMKAGRWMYSGQPIIFADDGQLNDGQHRLHGAVRAGASFETDVKFGVPREAFKVTDTGRKRTGGDILGIAGEQSASTLSAALRILASYKAGIGSLNGTFTSSELIECLNQEPGIRKSVEAGLAVYRGFKLIPPSVLAFCHYRLNGIHPEQAADFFDVLETGAGRKTDPVVILRNRIINKHNMKRRNDKAEVCALIFKAWNFRRKGMTLTHLRWRQEGDCPESFPVPE